MNTGSSVIWRAAGRLALGVIVVALLPYAWAPVYSFPDAVPFSGSLLWNPYASRVGTWQRANFHAHGRAWGGLTSGAQTGDDVVQRYHRLGYSVAGVSNYQRIAAFEGIDTLPVYEHGFNVGKTHQLAIGAHSVEWLDFAFWQTLSNQQYVIDRVHGKADLVSLNHPSSRDAYDSAAVRSLTNYNLIEVVNGPFTFEDVWDAALSAGRPVWALANDDTHDLNDYRRTGVGWNMIDARSAATNEIVSAVGAGRFYSVLRTGALESANVTTLSAVAVHGSTMRVALDGAPSTIAFVGQDGTVRETVKDTLAASYAFGADDTYIRAVVTSPQTVLYLNPVVRWNGAQLPAPAATVNAVLTWTQRGGIGLACMALVLLRKGRKSEHALAANGLKANLTT